MKKTIKLSDEQKSILWNSIDKKLDARVWFAKKKTIIAIITTLIATMWWVAYWAELALPGSVLYPIKVEINEPIQELIFSTKKNKTELYQYYIVKRSQEREKLKEKGKLTEKLQTQIAAKIELYESKIEQENTVENKWVEVKVKEEGGGQKKIHQKNNDAFDYREDIKRDQELEENKNEVKNDENRDVKKEEHSKETQYIHKKDIQIIKKEEGNDNKHWKSNQR